MKNQWLIIAFTSIIILTFGIYSCSPTAPEETPTTDTSQDDQHFDKAFPDFGYMISVKDFHEKYPDREVFKLKQDYPSVKPADSQRPDFFDIPFDEGDKWLDYINAVRDYCFEGMIAADFNANKNTKREWYNMPWMHWGPQGTEGFSGLAKEAQISALQLTPEQKNTHQTYALGYYNEFAGYTLHEMWKDPRSPNPKATSAADGGGFPIGTVIFKLLYTDADETEVDYLVNPYSVPGYVTTTWDDINREVKSMQLIQMDFMVRDPRADKYGTGWVFGTYCYNGKLNEGKTGASRAENLVPVGIQFGNDLQDTTNTINPYPPRRTIINHALKETKINPDSTRLPPQHLGWGGRLDGPVDLNTASCMSCHATAEYPQTAALVPKEAFIGEKNADSVLVKLTETDSPAWRKYYTNLRCGTPYDAEATSCDFSLQVSLALGYFTSWNVDQDGLKYEQYHTTTSKATPHAQRGAKPHKDKHDID